MIGLESLFINRNDVYAIQTDNGAWALVTQSMNDIVLQKHLDGTLTTGVYQLDEQNEVKWICFDFDGVNAEVDAGKLFAHVKGTRYKKSSLLEHTGGRGFHVWICFANKVAAWQAKKIANELVTAAGVRCEIFPKQSRIDVGSYGNLVRLPLGVHKKTGKRSKLLEPETLDDIQPIFVEPEPEPAEERSSSHSQIHEAYPCWRKMFEGVSEGGRDVVAFTLARRLRSTQGFDQQLCRIALLEWNKNNNPPMKEKDIIKTVKSAYEKEYPNIGCVQIKNSDVLSVYCDERHCPKFEQTNKVLDEMEKAVGMEFLQSPDLLARIKKIFDEVIAGEDDTKLMMFLLSLTCLTDSPQFVVVKGESSAGKSYLVNNILEPYCKADMVIKFSRVTPRAMEYAELDFTNKILFVQELGGIGSQEQFRVWNSEKGLSLATIDDSEGSMKMKKMDIKGVPAFVTTTTQYELDAELETRTWTLSPNESNEQTKKILEYESKKQMMPNPSTDFSALIAALKCLKTKPVLIPFADMLTSCFQMQVKTRRDFKKLMTLIKTIAFLYQKQRPIAFVNGVEHIIATPIDLKYAIDIGLKFLRNTIVGLPESALQAFEVCEQMTNQALEITEENFSMQAGSSKKKKLLELLSKNGYLYCDEAKKPKRYQIVNSPDIMIASRLKSVADEVQMLTKEEIYGRYQVVENHDIFCYVNPFTSVREIIVLRKGG